MSSSATPRKKKVVSKKLSARPSSGNQRNRVLSARSPLTYLEEIYQMQLQESLQRKYNDTFWGIDKEARDQRDELHQMSIEDSLSRQLSFLSFVETHTVLWQHEYVKHKLNHDAITAIDKNEKRKAYLRNFYSTISTEVFDLTYLRMFDHSENINEPRRILSTTEIGQLIQLSSEATTSDDKRGFGSAPTSPYRHLRNRPYRIPHIGAPTVTTRDTKENKVPFVIDHYEGGVMHREPQKQRRMRQNNNNIFDRCESLSVENVYGHPLYGWDQEALLTNLFNLISVDGKITNDNLLSLSSNEEALTLLKYSVFGSYAKKKDWDIFLALLIDKSYLRLNEWLEAAKQLTIERNVRSENIRENEDHVNFCESLSKCRTSEQRSSLEARRKATAWTRLYNVQRNVHVGDLVWAKHGNGTIWLPAVVTAVDWDDDDDDSTVSYQLKYPFTKLDVIATQERVSKNESSPELKSLLNEKADDRLMYKQLWETCFGESKSVEMVKFLDNMRKPQYRGQYFSVDRLFSRSGYKEYSLPILQPFLEELFSDNIVPKDSFVELMLIIQDLGEYSEVSKFHRRPSYSK